MHTIRYYSNEVEQEILDLPESLQARYIHYSGRMRKYGPNLGEPHNKGTWRGYLS